MCCCWSVAHLIVIYDLGMREKMVESYRGTGGAILAEAPFGCQNREKSAQLCSRSSQLRKACSPYVCRNLYSPNTGGCEVTNDFSDQQIEAFCCETYEADGNVSSDLVPPLVAGAAAAVAAAVVVAL